MKLTERELATVLAALRLYQEALIEDAIPPRIEMIASWDTRLSVKEIDELCERLNS